ncbi:MAG: copper-binding protein [Betaproteobacteria bacterium]
MNKLTMLLVGGLATFSVSALAQVNGNLGDRGAPVVVAQASVEMTEGEVRKVNKEAKKITLKHGELKNLDMPAMTMVFQVQDPALLDQVKAGDKVRFTADRVGGQFTVTKIEPMK